MKENGAESSASNSRNIVFLDFDGVIVVRASGYLEAHPPCVAVLNEILERGKADIVVSSSWRIGRTLAQLKGLLAGWGVKGEVLGCTPHGRRSGGMFVGVPRGQEIHDWLQQRGLEKFVILDDDTDMEPLVHKLVQTKFEDGLQPVHIDQALKVLCE